MLRCMVHLMMAFACSTGIDPPVGPRRRQRQQRQQPQQPQPPHPSQPPGANGGSTVPRDGSSEEDSEEGGEEEDIYDDSDDGPDPELPDEASGCVEIKRNKGEAEVAEQPVESAPQASTTEALPEDAQQQFSAEELAAAARAFHGDSPTSEEIGSTPPPYEPSPLPVPSPLSPRRSRSRSPRTWSWLWVLVVDWWQVVVNKTKRWLLRWL